MVDGRIQQILMIEAHGAGQGGNIDGDGVNTRRVNVGNTGNTPSEVLESSFPIKVLRYEISEDGGGAGRSRGGTGIFREIKLEHDATVTITAERSKFPPYGLFGGLPARPAKYWIKLPGGAEQILPSKTVPMFLPCGTIIGVQPAGGGGYGPPTSRALSAIQNDLDDGYVSAAQAEELYKVKIRRADDRLDGGWVVTGRD